MSAYGAFRVGAAGECGTRTSLSDASKTPAAPTGAEVALIALEMVGVALILGPKITGSTLRKEKIEPARDKGVADGKQTLEAVGKPRRWGGAPRRT